MLAPRAALALFLRLLTVPLVMCEILLQVQVSSNASFMFMPSQAALDAQSKLHMGSMVKEAADRDQVPRIPTRDTSSRYLAGLEEADFDALESFDEASGLCIVSKRLADGTMARSPAYGLIQRYDRDVVPRVMGNSEGSYCAVSHQYEFVFVHILKNAGTSTKGWLKAALCPLGECDPYVLSFQDCGRAMFEKPQYLRWSWIRNPFDRALSIYAMAKNYDMPEGIDFNDFWLSDDRWSSTSLSPDHGRSQGSFAASANKCLALDFIGLLPEATYYMEKLTKLIDAPRLTMHLIAEGFQPPTKGNVFGSAASKDGGTGQARVANNDKLRDALEEEFQDDFALFTASG